MAQYLVHLSLPTPDFQELTFNVKSIYLVVRKAVEWEEGGRGGDYIGTNSSKRNFARPFGRVWIFNN